MEKEDAKKYLNFAIRTAREAGHILLNYCGKNFKIDYKGSGRNNLVTEVDRKSEKLIVDAIKYHFPDHCVLSEEGGDCGIKPSDYKWIIDPIDGTTNFAHGYHSFAISIGLEHKGKMIAGVVYAPVLNELYSASLKGGSFLNGKKIRVSKVREIELSLLATGFTYQNREANVPNFIHFLYKAQGIRRCGAATLDLCHLAAGRLDGYWEMGLRPWDMAAGTLIVKEAGGRITALDGSPFELHGKSLLATNGLLHQEMKDFFTEQNFLDKIPADQSSFLHTNHSH